MRQCFAPSGRGEEATREGAKNTASQPAVPQKKLRLGKLKKEKKKKLRSLLRLRGKLSRTQRILKLKNKEKIPFPAEFSFFFLRSSFAPHVVGAFVTEAANEENCY